MAIRNFKAALLVAFALVLAPQLLAQKNSRSTYTPPPPRPYTPPPRTPTPSNSNTRSGSQGTSAANSNTVRPTPRPSVTPRNPQPGRTPGSISRTPANVNSRARQVSNSNTRNPQTGNGIRTAAPPKLPPQKQATVQARLGKLRVGDGQRGALSNEFKGPARGSASAGGSGKPPGGNGTDGRHAANDDGKTGTGDKPPQPTPVKKDDRPIFRPNGPKPGR